MRSLLSDEDPEVQEHALALLRNLCMHSASDAQAVVAWAQGELVPALEDKMDPSSSRWAGVGRWCVCGLLADHWDVHIQVQQLVNCTSGTNCTRCQVCDT